jgi:hypothetical protein
MKKQFYIRTPEGIKFISMSEGYNIWKKKRLDGH